MAREPYVFAGLNLLRSKEHLLVVWNLRYNKWTLPGGLVEQGESIEDACARELLEETGCVSVSARRVYDAGISRVIPGRANYAHVLYVSGCQRLSLSSSRLTRNGRAQCCVVPPHIMPALELKNDARTLGPDWSRLRVAWYYAYQGSNTPLLLTATFVGMISESP